MTHDEIEAQNLAERYVLGKLRAEESACFEEHFVDCPLCLDRLETVERLSGALKRTSGGRGLAPVVPMPARARPRAVWLLAAAVLLSLGVSLVLGIRSEGALRELAQARLAAADWQRRYQSEHDASEALRRSGAQPLLASTFFLSIPRSGAADSAGPVNRVAISSDRPWVVLSLEGTFDRSWQSLRTELKDSAGKLLWQQTGPVPAAGAAPSVVLPAAMLPPGDYTLGIDGVSANGGASPAGRYRFRVVAR